MTDVDPDLARAYAALLDQPHADLDEFAASLGIDEKQAHAVLDRLAAMSLVEERDHELVALSPMLAMQELITREHDLMEQRQRFLRESFQTLTEVMPRYVHYRPSIDDKPLVEQITDLSSIRHRLEELAVSAQHEVLSFTPPARNPGAARAATRSLDRSVLARGVEMRTIYPEAIIEDPGAHAYARELIEAGGQVRICPTLPMRMVIVDRVRAVVPNDPDDATWGCAIICHRGTVLALIALFDRLWEAGHEVAAAVEQDEGSIMQRAVLRLLMQGAKDDAVAHKMQVSVRTVRRCIAEMMERLGATSRFELGVSAARHGWI